jgi:hypothetical protein
VRDADGQRKAALEFRRRPQPRFGLRRPQASQIDPLLAATGG